MRLQIWLTCLPLVCLLAGCARFPTNPTDGGAPPRTIVSEMRVRGVINPAYYYFLAFNTDPTGATGPLPVVTGPELGNGWSIIGPVGPNTTIAQPPFYVEYSPNTAGSFRQFRLNTTTNQYEPLGQPFRGEILADGKGMRIEIDQSLLGTPIPDVAQLNWITMETITVPPQGSGIVKEYDGIGNVGNDYFSFPTNVSKRWLADELPDEYDRDTGEQTTSIADIDLTGWNVEVRILSTASP